MTAPEPDVPGFRVDAGPRHGKPVPDEAEVRAVAEQLAGLAVARYCQRLDVIADLYEGPWERWRLWLLAEDWRTGRIRAWVPPESARGQLASWCAAREEAWRSRYASRSRFPPARWRRRMTRG